MPAVRQLNIAVGGCGIGGMAAALLLARDGHRITIFDRFEEPRQVGSGLMLQPTGLAVLQQLGLGNAAMLAGQRIYELTGLAGHRVVLDVRYSALGSQFFGVGIHRSALFALLHDSLRAERVTVAADHRITGVELRDDGISIAFDRNRSEGPFDLVIDALGTRSPLSAGPGKDLRYGALWTDVALPPAGFDRHMLSQRYRRSSVMAGVLPVGTSDRGEPRAAFFWSLRAEDHEAWLAAGLDRWKGEVQALWPATLPILEQIRSLEQLTFARYAHKTLRRPVGERLIHIGDSWHSASPQLGQGANMALLDAYAVATALRHGCDLSDSLTRAFRTRRNHVRLYQLLTALLTPVYQSDSRIIPVVRDWVMGPLSRIWPMTSFQAALVSGLVGSPLRKLGIDFAPPQVGS